MILYSAFSTGTKCSLSKASCVRAVFHNHQGKIVKGDKKLELLIEEHGGQSITSFLLIKIL